MNTVDILDAVAARGLTLNLEGSNLRLEGPESAIDPEIIQAIRDGKDGLIQRLRRREVPGGERFELTSMQASYFYGRQDHFALGGVSSHVYREIVGDFDPDRLERALGRVVARHVALRTSFADDGSQSERSAHEVPVHVTVADLRGRPAAEQDAARAATRDAMSHQVLEAARAPLIDVRLTLLDDSGVLHVSHDGLVIDGMSAFLFFDDWWRFYADPEAASEPLAVDIFDHLRAMASGPRDGIVRARRYWADRIASLPPHPQLPLVENPETQQCPPRSVRRVASLDALAWASFKERTGRRRLTPTAALISAYAEILSLWGAGERFTLNLTVADRRPIHDSIDRVIGNFTDCLLLPVDIDPAANFEARATAIQGELRAGLDHRGHSGIEVMREIGRQAGLGRAAPMPFTFNSAIGGACDGSAIAQWGREVHAVSQTPQVWVNAFAFERDGALVVEFDTVDALFPEKLFDGVVAGYERLLEVLSADEAAWKRTDYGLLPPDQLKRRRETNRTTAPIPGGQAHTAFLARADATPLALAVRAPDRSLSYEQLRAGAFAVARWLRARGIGRGDVVGIAMRKGWEQIVAILGIGVAGAAYLPIDADLPPARVVALVASGGVRSVLTQGRCAPTLGPEIESLTIDGTFLDAAWAAEAGTRAEDVSPAEADQADLAYILPTSGSTGFPKGVMIAHRSVVNLVTDMCRRFELLPDDRVFGVSSVSFDLSVFDVFATLSVGAALVLPAADRSADPEHWLQTAAEGGVSIWNSVPPIAGMLVEHASAAGAMPPHLRLFLLSGDRIPPHLPGRIMALKPDARVVALGGPTETTVWNVVHPIDSSTMPEAAIPYGRPTANNRAYVLDAQMRACPDHVPGMLYAAGEGLALGYRPDRDGTSTNFFFWEPLGERLYSTGDMARYRADGALDILGRADARLKLNGYRIDPGEIEMVLAGSPDVAAAAVAVAGADEDPRLIACMVRRPTGRSDEEAGCALVEALGHSLPDYMVPRSFVWLRKFPLTPNGKVDRAALLRAAAIPSTPAAAESAGETAPDSELARELCAIWADILKIDAVGAGDSFYGLGGTSLLGVRLLARVRKAFGVSVPFKALPRLDTPHGMAAHLDPILNRVKVS